MMAAIAAIPNIEYINPRHEQPKRRVPWDEWGLKSIRVSNSYHEKPHQGKKEMERRRKRMEKAAKKADERTAYEWAKRIEGLAWNRGLSEKHFVKTWGVSQWDTCPGVRT